MGSYRLTLKAAENIFVEVVREGATEEPDFVKLATDLEPILGIVAEHARVYRISELVATGEANALAARAPIEAAAQNAKPATTISARSSDGSTGFA